MMTQHAGMVRHTLIALAITAAFPAAGHGAGDSARRQPPTHLPLRRHRPALASWKR